jgi:hypothetical protein
VQNINGTKISSNIFPLLISLSYGKAQKNIGAAKINEKLSMLLMGVVHNKAVFGMTPEPNSRLELIGSSQTPHLQKNVTPWNF